MIPSTPDRRAAALTHRARAVLTRCSPYLFRALLALLCVNLALLLYYVLVDYQFAAVRVRQ